MKPLALAIDIGGTKIAAAAVEPYGVVTLRYEAVTPTEAGPEAILRTTLALGKQVLDEALGQGRLVAAAGVGSAGHVDHLRGRISYASRTLPGWSGTELRRQLESGLGLPVSTENDVNALALGENRFGAGRGFSDALFVAVGTGVGGALILDGKLRRGISWTAGELGHLLIDSNGVRPCSCGQLGHLEAYASGPAMAARYCHLAGIDQELDLRVVARLARDGERLAHVCITEGARTLGLALGGLLNVIDPQALIVGGGVAALGEPWWSALDDALRANAMPGPAGIILRRAELGADAALIGAAWLALSEHAPELVGALER